MKATGVVRRIDDLGRIVIPKEIRKTLRIREGDPLEIFTDKEGEIILKKYSPIGELNEFASQYAETLHKTCNLSILICDRDAVIAVSGISKKEYIDKTLSSELDSVMQGRSIYKYSPDKEKIYAVDGTDHYIRCAVPIISEGDILGCVVSIEGNEKKNDSLNSDVETNLIMTAANFLGRQMES